MRGGARGFIAERFAHQITREAFQVGNGFYYLLDLFAEVYE